MPRRVTVQSLAQLEQLAQLCERGLVPRWALNAIINAFTWEETRRVSVRAVVCLALQCATGGHRILFLSPGELVRLGRAGVGYKAWAWPKIALLTQLTRRRIQQRIFEEAAAFAASHPDSHESSEDSC